MSRKVETPLLQKTDNIMTEFEFRKSADSEGNYVEMIAGSAGGSGFAMPVAILRKEV
tara:strand:+ start:414 stop:584 length:171 start_codon:yes stop_codon:yes gene_type:complete